MGEHPLTVQARAMSGDPEQHRRVAEVAARLDAQLAEALACDDAGRARELLPAAVRAVSVAARDLVGGGLVSGSAWFDQAHRQLYTKAEQQLGPGQQVVQRPNTEPFPIPGRGPGPRSMFGL